MFGDAIYNYLKNKKNEILMIDALYQWTLNPTSKSAGYGLKENYPYIKSNLIIRYNLSGEEADTLINDLKKLISEIYKEHEKSKGIYGTDTYTVRGTLADFIETVYGEKLRKIFLERLKNATSELQDIIYIIAKLYAMGFIKDIGLYDMPCIFDSKRFIQSIYTLTFERKMPPIEELIKIGLLNKLLWITARRERRNVLEFSDYLKPILENIEQYVSPSFTPNFKKIETDIKIQLTFEEVCSLEEIVQIVSSNLALDNLVSFNSYVIDADRVSTYPPYIQGIVGTINSTIFVSPIYFSLFKKIYSSHREELYTSYVKPLIPLIRREIEQYIKQELHDASLVMLASNSFLINVDPPIKIFVDLFHTYDSIAHIVFDDLESHYIFIAYNQPTKSIDFIFQKLWREREKPKLTFIILEKNGKVEDYSNYVLSPSTKALVNYLTRSLSRLTTQETEKPSPSIQTPHVDSYKEEQNKKEMILEAEKITITFPELILNVTKISGNRVVIVGKRKGRVRIKFE